MIVTMILTALLIWICAFIIFWDFHRSNKKFIRWLRSLHPGKVLFFPIVLVFGVSLTIFIQTFYKWGDKVFGAGEASTDLMYGFFLVFIYGSAFLGGKTATGNYNLFKRPVDFGQDFFSKLRVPGFSQIYKFFTLVLMVFWTLYFMLIVAGQFDSEAFGLSTTIVASLGGLVYLFFMLHSLFPVINRSMGAFQIIALSLGGFFTMIGSLYIISDWGGGFNLLLIALVMQILALCIGFFQDRNKLSDDSNIIPANNIHCLFLIVFTLGVLFL